MSLFSCEIELNLSWSTECMISEMSIISGIHPDSDANPPVQEVAVIEATGATFQVICSSCDFVYK